MRLRNKKILIGITGSIAAYKSAELIRNLREEGAEVRVVMTESAKQFITPLTMQILSGNTVHSDLFDIVNNTAIEHIELARWPDVILIAPASANLIASLAHGFANDLLTSICLATTSKIILAPAMNQQMWRNSLTQENLQKLLVNKIECWGPDEGSQACGEFGPGRMLNPENLLQKIIALFAPGIFTNCHILVTAGPTQEAIDPVRYISNHSSGKMGYAIATAAAAYGAKVTLITGPTKLPYPEHINCISVITAEEMYQAVMNQIQSCQIFISTAAVADYRLEQIADHKLKKSSPVMTLKLIRNPDILTSVAALPNTPFTVGFAAETDNILINAKEKLKNKNVSLIIANRVGKNIGFNSEENAVTIINSNNETTELPLTNKTELANQLMPIIYRYWQEEKNETSPNSKGRKGVTQIY